MAVAIGFPLIIYAFNRVVGYILAFAAGFGTLMLIFWALSMAWNRRR